MEFNKDTLSELKDLRDDFAKVNTVPSQTAMGILNKVIYKGQDLDRIQTAEYLDHVRRMCTGKDKEDKEERLSELIRTVVLKR